MASEPWREAFDEYVRSEQFTNDFRLRADADGLQVGWERAWQALASLPELVEVLEAAKHCEEAVRGVGQASGWAASCRLDAALSALKARMEMKP